MKSLAGALPGSMFILFSVNNTEWTQGIFRH